MTEDLNPIYTIIAALLGILAGVIISNKGTGRILKGQDEIKALLNQKDVSKSFNKIIKVNEGIIENLENISKDANEGDILTLIGKSSAVDVTLRENEYLELNGDFTFVLSNDIIRIQRISGKWKEVSRTNNP